MSRNTDQEMLSRNAQSVLGKNELRIVYVAYGIVFISRREGERLFATEVGFGQKSRRVGYRDKYSTRALVFLGVGRNWTQLVIHWLLSEQMWYCECSL